MNVTYSPISLSAKPRKEQNEEEFVRLMSTFSNAAHWLTEEVDVEQFLKLCINGHAWLPCTFKSQGGKRSKNNVDMVHNIALDFDSCKYKPEEVVRYAEGVSLPVNFMYYSYSQDPATLDFSGDAGLGVYYNEHTYNKQFYNVYKGGYNFRIVWSLEKPITHTQYTQIITTLIDDTFSQFNPDESPKDVCRLWFGGCTAGVLYSAEPIALSSLGWQTVIKKSKEGVPAYRIHNAKRGLIPEYEELPEGKHITVTKGWTEKLRGYNSYWDKWLKGEYVEYNHRITLWANLRYLHYSSHDNSVIQDILSYVDWDVYLGKHQFSEAEIREKFNDKNLKPVPIITYRSKRMTIAEFLEIEGKPEYVYQDRCEQEELEGWMKNEMVYSMRDNSMVYIKSQTASGKTEYIIQDFKDREFNIGKEIYAASTHNLCREFEERLRETGIETPIYRIGEREYSNSDIIRLNLGLEPLGKDAERSKIIRKLFDEKEKGIFIMTHSLLVLLGANIDVDRIIVDENIEDTLVTEIKISRAELNTLTDWLSDSVRWRLCLFTKALADGEYEFGEVLDKQLFLDIQNDIGKRLEDYLECAGAHIAGLFKLDKADFIKVSKTASGDWAIRAVMKSELIDAAMQKNVPIKLLTATPMTTRLKKYYGYEFKVLEAPFAKNTGKVIQHAAITGARGVMNSKVHDMIEHANKMLNADYKSNAQVISFKGTAELWLEAGYNVPMLNNVQIHLMNNAGLDFLKGRNLIVAGKFDKPDVYYQDLWSDIGDGSTPHKKNQVIERNGRRQTLFLWDKEELREAQLETIEYAITQAVGRARVLREPIEVHYFSNFTIPGTDEIVD